MLRKGNSGTGSIQGCLIRGERLNRPYCGIRPWELACLGPFDLQERAIIRRANRLNTLGSLNRQTLQDSYVNEFSKNRLPLNLLGQFLQRTKTLKTLLKCSLLALALSLTASTSARAGGYDPYPRQPKTAPEVDPSLAMSGLALLAGALSVARAKRSKA